ncbi:MAG TPA: M64 family metallopeptidase [Candidatus Polarisedimenticolaceae bacterium]|nr:M64 family metallopeptidase [Candidatus Polarisedimenticolaceae bacterium]
MSTLEALLLAVGAMATPAVAAEFDEWFTGATIRVDYAHVGTAAEEHFALERVRVEGPWPGSRTRTIDTTNLGRYLVELVDLESNRVLYTRGFASIFGEWESTSAARSGVWRSIAEAVRVPEPKRPFQLRIRKRDAGLGFAEVWQTTIDPSSRFVDRVPPADHAHRVLLDHGDPAIKVDLVVLGDGYTAGEIERFRDDAAAAAAALFAEEPFAARTSSFNVRIVETPARASGITRPRAGVFRDSPLGARYDTFDSERYVLTLDDRAWRDRAAVVPYDFVLILVNERQYGGGGIHGRYSTAAAGSSYADYLVVHEFGHHFAGLGDEYYTSDVAYESTDGPLVEPWEPNVTAQFDPARLKWGELVTEGTALPTPWVKQAYEQQSLDLQQRRRELRARGAPEEELERLFDEERERLTDLLRADPNAGIVGAFEGAMYRPNGLYRPAVDCIMFTRDRVGFCPVCRRAIERVIEMYDR